MLVTDPVIRPAAPIDLPVIKDFSSTIRSSFLQEINYRYNIRGWLTQVNSTGNLEAGDFGKKALFAMKLNYNTLDSEGIGEVKKLYNGNIVEQSWKTAQDNVLRRYSYGYDKLSRLKAGIYQEPEGTTPLIGLYDERMNYDVNGNITSLNRKGRSVNTAIALDLDQLTYSYDGNILQKVEDASNNTDGFKQGSTAAKHYDYDSFGNLKVDRNKGITSMKYNHLNLPTEVVFAAGKITYLYTATGEKVQKKVTQGSSVVVTDYVDGFQYVDGVLSFFPTAEGYFNAETQNYVYQYRDHLGNVRLSYSDSNKNDKIDIGEIIEETNYYPFGLAHQGYNEKNNTIAQNYKYQYNGKENQEELGLNLYDYGARNYDAAIGRWMNVDPLAEEFPGWNPYHYVHNNPVNMTDPTGMSAEDLDDIRFKDREGNLIATYYTEEIDKDVKLNQVNVGVDLNINLNNIESTAKKVLPDVDVVGFGISTEAIAGFGAGESIDVFYHLDGKDEGEISTHFTASFKVGTLSAGGSVYGLAGNYTGKDGDKKGFSADRLNGRSYSVGGGVSVGGAIGVTGSYTYTTDTGNVFGETNYKQLSFGISAGLPTSLPISVSGSVNETKLIWKSKK